MKTQFKWIQSPLVLSLLLVLSSVSSTVSFEVKANVSAGTKAQAKAVLPVDIEMKCHVELMGGGELISFTNVPYKNIKELRNVLIGQKVKLTSESSAQAIYKIKECVLLQEKFKGRRAQQLFLDTPQ
ncbi:MAG: hypothetical protein COB45_12345 [Gammaproteobacteria bacterium]|jgi:hypothetical protein|nr:MAG: hypothetical protein COB45_12345 [Gammaproteobacteria bacterium]PHR80540.1 MAG: hypothetical protein COA59_17385 [Colwellia sp.]